MARFWRKGSLRIASSPTYDEDENASITMHHLTDDEVDGSALSTPTQLRFDDAIDVKPLNNEILAQLKSEKATEEDIIKILDKITPENFDINYQFKDRNNNTLLHEAAISGKPNVLKELMKYKPKLNAKNSEGNTALISLVKECIECSQDESSKVKEQGDRTDNAGKPQLIKSDSQKSFRVSKEKIIPCKKHFACLQVLLEKKVDLEEENNLNLSVLSYATMCSDQKREEYLKALLSIHEKGSFATELYQALESKLDIQFLEELYRIWPKIEDEKFLQFMYKNYTLLQIVSKFGMIESAKRLIEIGADLHFKPIINHEPIQLACIFSRPEILKLLLEKDENAILIKSKNGRNLIHSTVKNIADSEGAYECLKILLNHKNKININEADKYGRTPLHYAVLHDSDACVVELLENGAELDREDNWKQTPLMHISESAFKKYLDNMISDERNEKADAHDKKEEIKSESKKLKNNQREKHNKKKEKSRKLVFNFRNLFRKIDPNDPKHKRKTSTTLSIDQKIEMDEPYYSFPTELLHKIKKVKRLRHLIQHPIFGIIIYFKWLHIRVFFLLYLVLYLLFSIIFTAYIYMSEDRPLKKTSAKSELYEILGYNRGSTSMLASIRLVNIIDLKLYFIFPLIGLLILFISFEWMKMTQSKWKYIDTDNILRLIVIIFAVLVLLCLNTTLLNPYCAQIKAISVLLTWFELFLVVGKYPNLSYFVTTFRSASLNLFKFVSVHIILLIGFALSFHILFRTYSTDNPFTNPFNSLFKTIIMLTSEFDASEIPFNAYSIVSHFIFIGYIFIATIVLFNLMIGIAFQHVDKMKKNPPLYKSLAQIYYIKHFEDNFSKNMIIRTLYNWLSPRLCCQGEHNDRKLSTKSIVSKDSKESQNSKGDEMTLKVSVKGNRKEFDRYLIFDTYPIERVRMKDKPFSKNTKDTSEEWPMNLYCLKIYKLFHTLNDNVIDNAQKIVSQRFSKNEELKQEDLNLKANFDILRNEMIELRRFVQKSFDDLKEVVQNGKTEESKSE